MNVQQIRAAMPGRLGRRALSVLVLAVVMLASYVSNPPASHAVASCAGPGNVCLPNIGDDYPHKNAPMDGGYGYGGFYRECTDFVAWRLNRDGAPGWYAWGNGNGWDDTARARGVRVDRAPALGAVAQWDVGDWGHVAYVAGISADGTRVFVEEYNYGFDGRYNSRWIPASSPSNYLHVHDLSAGPSPTSAGTSIQNPSSQRCVDVSGASPAAGTAIQLFDCNGSAAQSWRYVGDTLRVFGSPERCLDVTGGNLARGTAVQTWECTDGNGAQKWSLRSDGTIRTSNGLCLEARDGATSNGTRLQVWDCNGTPAQMWAGPALDNGGTSIQNPISGRCVDVAGGLSTLHNAVQLFDCNGTAAQFWVRDGQRLRVYGNECLDVKDGTMKRGQPVQLWQCTNDNGAQKWTVKSDGTIQTVNGLCLDAINAGTANGTRLQVWDCNGSQAQMWAGPALDNGGWSIQGVASGRCIDVAEGSSALHAAIQLFDCNNTAAQHWARDGQRLRMYGNECLDITDGALKRGQLVQLWQCTHDNGAQKWALKSDGTIRTLNGLCLDARDGAKANGTRLQVWDCNGTPAQQWKGFTAEDAPPASPPPPPPSQPGTGSPAVSAPAAVSGVRVAFPKHGVAVLTWPAVANATEYRVRLSKRNSVRNWYGWRGVQVARARVKHLRKGSTYRLQVFPLGPGGAGPVSTWRFRQRR